jgi:hypothetical protein
MEKIEIPVSKGKMGKLTLYSLLLTAGSVWMLVSKSNGSNRMLNIPGIKTGIAIVGILFFGFSLIYYIKKWLNKKPAIIIDDMGITVQSGAISVGNIPWQDITGLTRFREASQEFLAILLKDPQSYITRQSGGWKRWLMRMNYKRYGSPVQIPANAVACSLDELKTMVEQRLKP